ncbi:hypothetical protein J4E89_000211 [Alternaria sp. Ai002NY15]|nr:hypothetical protein J4E89_000211 [Alternaria sp. Ai002NY15]
MPQMYDTQEPRNLGEDDLHEDMLELPPSRSETELTQLLYSIVLTRLRSVQARIVDLVNATSLPPYGEITEMDATLRDVFEKIPQSPASNTFDDLSTDLSPDFMRYTYLNVAFLKAELMLHRPYFVLGRTDSRYTYSRRVCLNAAIEMLRLQSKLDAEVQPGGRLTSPGWRLSTLSWYMSSIIAQDFLLATTVLVVELDEELIVPIPLGSELMESGVQLDQASPTQEEIVASLRSAYHIWIRASKRSQEARKVATAVKLVLSKVHGSGVQATDSAHEETFYTGKEIAIEPDLGDLRKSTDKALPAPPKTPKRVLMKYRFSAILSIAFAAASFVFTLVLVLAGSDEHMFGGQYIVALNTTTIARASSQSDTTSKRPEGVDGEALADVYYLYLRTVCSGSISDAQDDASDIVAVELCESYSEASDTGVRYTVFASLLVSLIGAGFSAVSAIPAIIFPHSKLLAYFNIFWPLLSSAFAFVAAVLLTVLISGVFSVAGDIIDVAGGKLNQGTSVLLIVWLAFVLVSLSVAYWGVVWLVEVRRSGLTRRKRSDEEVGNWKNIGKEIWSDVKGTKRL